LESAKRDLHDQIEELKKNLRLESNTLSEARDFNRQMQVELDGAKRTIEKMADIKKELDLRYAQGGT
jgi:hypothetical protein